jgi:hypothetical protein
MNERIKELAEQARDYADDCFRRFSNVDGWNVLYTEKFAELIVRECTEINKQELSFNAFEKLLNRYEEHFGVEE